MKPVILYTLKAEKVAYSTADDVVKYGIINPIRIDDDENYLSATVDKIAMPIHHVRRAFRTSNRPFESMDIPYNIEDYFIALEPALAEILEAPFRERASKQIEEMKIRINNFNQLSWWKRIVAAIKKDI